MAKKKGGPLKEFQMMSLDELEAYLAMTPDVPRAELELIRDLVADKLPTRLQEDFVVRLDSIIGHRGK